MILEKLGVFAPIGTGKAMLAFLVSGIAAGIAMPRTARPPFRVGQGGGSQRPAMPPDVLGTAGQWSRLTRDTTGGHAAAVRASQLHDEAAAALFDAAAALDDLRKGLSGIEPAGA